MDKKGKLVLISSNKKAFFDYEIWETWEAGIQLEGYEVKSLREWKINLKGSFIGFLGKELYLKWCLIPQLGSMRVSLLVAKPDRKLFLHKKTIDYLSIKTKEPGKTIVPLEIYFLWSLVKVKVALAQGKKKYDKKQKLKERDMDRQSKVQMKNLEN